MSVMFMYGLFIDFVNLQFFCCFQVNLLIALYTGWDIGMNLLVPSCDRISMKKMTIARGLGGKEGCSLEIDRAASL